MSANYMVMSQIRGNHLPALMGCIYVFVMKVKKLRFLVIFLPIFLLYLNYFLKDHNFYTQRTDQLLVQNLNLNQKKDNNASQRDIILENSAIKSADAMFSISQNDQCFKVYDIKNATTQQQKLLYMEPIGRFGNNLFQLAALFSLAKETCRIPLMGTSFNNIKDIFDIKIKTQIKRPRLKFLYVDDKHGFANYSSSYKENLVKNRDKNAKLYGFYQSWKYFDNYNDDIREMFQLNKNYEAMAYYNKEEACKRCADRSAICTHLTYVGIHVRRNMIKTNYASVNASFVHRAMDFFRTNYKHPIFIIASDDLQYCRQHFLKNDTYILPRQSPLIHFATLMSCDHSIITVGSFGWWAAWLAGGKTVYYEDPVPRHLKKSKGFVYRDYIPPGWIPMR